MKTVPALILGKCRSIKDIFSYDTKDREHIRRQTKDYSKRDHFDSYCLFQFKCLEAMRQYGEFSPELEHMLFMSAFHRDSISEEFLVKEKESLGLSTSIDIIIYGERLLKHFFQK